MDVDINITDSSKVLINRAGHAMTIVVLNLFRIIALAVTHSTRAALFISGSSNYFRTPKRCPKIEDKILLVPARELSAMIRRREVTSEAVVTAYISRIEAVNPLLNAVVEEQFDLAIQNAKIVDSMLSTTNLTVDELERKYPLLGLPLTIKESISVEGCSNAAGATFAKPRIAKMDAPVVKLCKEAGAIPIALTNTPEFCINFESYNYITGTTNNPYDVRRTSAGSSGGEAALLGSAASLIGLGSDLFGSIRIPASFCGVWGHKPSPNLVSVEGHFPNCEANPLWPQFFTMGPMSRYASDLSLLMQVIQKRPIPTLNGNKISIKDINIYYMENDGGSFLTHSVDEEIVGAMQNLVNYLSTVTTCKKIQIEDFEFAGDYSFSVLTALVNKMDISLDDVEHITELGRYLTFRSNYTFLTVLSIIAQRRTPQFMYDLSDTCFKKVTRIKKKICDILGDNGVLLFPTHPTPPTFHNQCYGKFKDYTYTGIFNIIGLPVTQCPLGLNSQGLPIGIQVLAAPDNDGLTLAIAEEIERNIGGWIPPRSD